MTDATEGPRECPRASVPYRPGRHRDPTPIYKQADDHERINSYSLCYSGGGSMQEVEPIFCDCVYPVTAGAGWLSL